MVFMTNTPIAMPAEPSERAWQFLARVARDRREFIGLSQEELAEFGGPGKSTVGKVERAAQKGYPQRTQQQLEKALGWNRGAIREILHLADADYFEDQGEAIAADYVEAELPDLTTTNNPHRSAANLTDDELLAELTYRMRRYALEKEGKSHGNTPEKIGDLGGDFLDGPVEDIPDSPPRPPVRRKAGRADGS